ncbi:hypothetical protein F5Y19DRAFT_458129 [Xylariaceae sp. FL1651]|nr:hypothetical protein F5Y19DRAFT_458129 [Xylariaceae sp. FL1651]
MAALRMADMRIPTCRSDSEFHFTEEQIDAIIRITASPCEHPDSSIAFLPPKHELVQQFIALPFPQAAHTGLGSLNRLPLELIRHISLCMDMRSLFAFRQVNRRARQVANSLQEYRLVASHGLDMYCALLRTQTAANISLSDFYHMLCIKACAFCGMFAKFVFLPTWNRCCFNCLHLAPEVKMRRLEDVQQDFGLSNAQVERLTKFRIPPGTRLPRLVTEKTRTTLAPCLTLVREFQAALLAGCDPRAWGAGRGRGRGAPTRADLFFQHGNFSSLAACALPYYDERTRKVAPGLSCVGCGLAMHDPLRWSVHACHEVYARADFLEHFGGAKARRRCGC